VFVEQLNQQRRLIERPDLYGGGGHGSLLSVGEWFEKRRRI